MVNSMRLMQWEVRLLLFSCMGNTEGIAVCLACGNEWTVRDPGVKKKRKCPVCGKYRIHFKSGLPEITADNGVNPEIKKNRKYVVFSAVLYHTRIFPHTSNSGSFLLTAKNSRNNQAILPWVSVFCRKFHSI
jgi:hypothetical protein